MQYQPTAHCVNRDEIFERKRKILDEITAKELKPIDLKKGDICRIQVPQPPNALKKFHRPWSKDVNEVMELLFYSKTVLLQKCEISERIRRTRLRCPVRLVKKIRRTEDLIKEFNLKKIPSNNSAKKLPEENRNELTLITENHDDTNTKGNSLPDENSIQTQKPTSTEVDPTNQMDLEQNGRYQLRPRRKRVSYA